LKHKTARIHAKTAVTNLARREMSTMKKKKNKAAIGE